MRELDFVSERVEPNEHVISLLSEKNSSGGPLFPNLERLRCMILSGPIPLAFFHLFLSERLKCVALRVSNPYHLRKKLEVLAQIISSLPTTLEILCITCHEPQEIQSAVSSLVRRCGSLLKILETNVPLEETAVLHLVKLPNLSSLSIYQGPPLLSSGTHSQTDPEFAFPSLVHLRIRGNVAPLWFDILASGRKRVIQHGSGLAIPSRDAGDILERPMNVIINSKPLTLIPEFQNLVTLRADVNCRVPWGDCTFRLTDEDMYNLATVLPRLKCLRLGQPCSANACKNTVASLVSISVHCLDLEVLETHFNTQTMTSDMQRLLSEGIGNGRAKCKVRELWVGGLPYGIERGEDMETVARGFALIFPSLGRYLKTEDTPATAWDQQQRLLAHPRGSKEYRALLRVSAFAGTGNW